MFAERIKLQMSGIINKIANFDKCYPGDTHAQCVKGMGLRESKTALLLELV